MSLKETVISDMFPLLKIKTTIYVIVQKNFFQVMTSNNLDMFPASYMGN